MTDSRFVVCVRNAGYEASLDRGKRYRLLPDPDAAAHRQVRVIDESGEDYLYPECWFAAATDRPPTTASQEITTRRPPG